MSGARTIGTAALTGLVVRSRLRSFRNGLRARGRRRYPLVLLTAGLVTSLAYVGLFAQAFSVVVATVGLTGQVAALALVAGTLALGTFSAKAASSEAVRAGSPENEFLLARPVSLAALVAARGLADAVTDPVGALFLLPVLLAAALVWGLPPGAWAMAAAISIAVQVSISMLAYATQLVVVRAVSPARRRGVWVALRLLAALALAALWMVGTWVMRAPAGLATHLAPLRPWLRFSPGRFIAAPLGAMAAGATGAALAGLGLLWLAAAAAVLGASAIARRAGMRGWEEAGAPWADATTVPRPGRLVTAANKDLLLVSRDRAQMLVLVAMPAIFVGIQIFGTAGWSWSTATLARVSCLAYSLALYMATIGPLTHMQAERRAFWLLRTVPVALGRLLAAKARAWAVIVGGAATAAFLALGWAMPPAPPSATIAAGLLVVLGAVAMSFLAVAMAAGGADLSDDQSAAVGPATIYAFLLVGGLYNLVLTGDATARLCGLCLYGFVVLAYWRAGVERAEICLDAEAVRTPRLRMSDGATLVVIYALAERGLVTAARSAHPGSSLLAIGGFGLPMVLGAVAASMLRRRARVRPARGPIPSLVIALVLGGAAGVAIGHPLPLAPGALTWLSIVALLLPEELIFRGAVQTAIEEELSHRPDLSPADRPGFARLWTARLAASGASAALGAIAIAMTTSSARGLGAAAAAGGAAALARALTGRVAAGFLARLAVVAAGAALATG